MEIAIHIHHSLNYVVYNFISEDQNRRPQKSKGRTLDWKYFEFLGQFTIV